MPFQRQGVEFALSRNGRCMIADEMGLGKTVQAIAAAYTYRQEWPLLVVVPSSLKYPWIEELERWLPELKPGDINLVENKSHTMGISSSKVTVLGYGLLTSDAGLCGSLWTSLITFKSRNAARTKILVPLIQNAKRAFLLTGTPASGTARRAVHADRCALPKEVRDWTDYAKKYCNAHYRYFGARRQWDCRGASNLDELHRQLSQIMIRRLKQDVLTQLPPQNQTEDPLRPAQGGRQGGCVQFRRVGAHDAGDEVKGRCRGQLLRRGHGAGHQMYKQTAVAKAGAVKDYIKMLLEAEQLKFLVFAHHLTMLQACTEAAIEAKAGYIRIDGSVPSSERIQLVHRFQSDPATRVAILSIQAAGQGLTFTAASHVVFAELYWNPGHMKQAEDRAHRIGQTCSVNVHYLIAKGTFDSVLWGMLNRKETVTGSTLNGRKEYLNAHEGDKDKWDFLNFASAWTPSEMVLPPGGTSKNVSEDVYFTHSNQTSPIVEANLDLEETIATPEDDFAPQQKRLKTPQSTPSPISRSGAKRRQTFGGSGSQSPLVSFLNPRRLTTAMTSSGKAWSCEACTYSNSGLLPYCEMCDAPRPSDPTPKPDPPPSNQDDPIVLSESDSEGAELPKNHHSTKDEEEKCNEQQDLQNKHGVALSPDQTADETKDQDEEDVCLPVYPGLQFCASQYTDRIYVYTKDGAALDCSFIPLDIQLNNWDELPRALSQRRQNRIQVMRFVQEWSGLTAMKQKLLRRSGILFHSPSLGLQQLANNQRPHASTKRYLGRDEVALASLDKAQKDGGSVRVVTRDSFFQKRKSASSLSSPGSEKCAESPSESMKQDAAPSELGYVQALDSSGVPLCLSCHQPCSTSGGAWDTRFCSHKCQEDFQLRSSQSYMRSRVLEVEQGVCQFCGLHAHELYLRVRDAPPSQRKQMLDNTWLAQLPLNKLNEMIRAPVEGTSGRWTTFGRLQRRRTVLAGQPADALHCVS
ncbi:hypothetical protein WMY93_022755 [Mugilogobius chulae]|uniref:DNA annealing helicase and endonuclease ZRANB3 n=1 Tax=Mugilogobius chulae TaxID=88201 RepID=A0AAW0N9E5_9GOBI